MFLLPFGKGGRKRKDAEEAQDSQASAPEVEPVDYDGLLRELLTVELVRGKATTGSVKGWLMLKGVTAKALAERLPEFWAREGAALGMEPLQKLARLRLEPLSEVAQQLLPVEETLQEQGQTASGAAAAESGGEGQGVDVLLLRLAQAFQAGDLQTAVQLGELATRRYPQSHLAWAYKGELMGVLQQHEAAIASYDQALAIKPDEHIAWNNRGNTLNDLGRLDEAIASYDEALAIKPDLHEAWYNRGCALYDLGKMDDAIASYDKALAIKLDKHEAWHNRGSSLSALGRLDEAIASYDKALAIQPDDHEAWYNRGVSLNYLGRLDEAIASYDKALAIKPDLHAAWYNRGSSLSALGRLDEAIASYDKALAIKPDFYEAWSNRGISLYALGRLHEAIASYDKALAIRLDLHQAWGNRSTAVANTPDYDPFSAAKRLKFGFTQPSPALLAFLQKTPIASTLSLTTCGYPGAVQTLTAGLSHCPAPTYGHGFLQRELGDAHWNQAKKEQSPRPLWRAARDAYNTALTILTATDHPKDHLKTLQGLIRVHLALGEIATARTYQTQGAQVFNNLRQPLVEKLNNAQTDPPKESARRAINDLDRQFTAFTQLEIDILIAENSPTAALEQAEFYKNRSLTWILDELNPSAGDDLTLSYAQIQTLCPANTAAIYWHQSPDHLTTFIILPSPKLGREAGGEGQSHPSPTLLTVDRATQHRQLETWQTQNDKHYASYRDKKRNPDHETRQQRQHHPWRQHLTTAIPSLQRILHITDIEAQLPKQITQLILIPHRDLHRLPLQALWSNRFTTRLLPSAQLSLQLQQSVVTLDAETTIADCTNYAPLLNINDPKTDQPPLPFAQLESAILRSLTQQKFPHQPITHIANAQATTAAITNALTNKTHHSLHFSGHGTFNLIYPERSALGLSDGNLTARAITQANLNHLQFINLAACETNLTGKQDRTTEYVGLPSAFLKAGAKTILSTLWNVDEIASCWFSIHFYQRCFSGSSPSQALHQTQQWMQTLTDAELINWIATLMDIPGLGYHWQKELKQAITDLQNRQGTIDENKHQQPFYWAAFTLTGLG